MSFFAEITRFTNEYMRDPKNNVAEHDLRQYDTACRVITDYNRGHSWYNANPSIAPKDVEEVVSLGKSLEQWDAFVAAMSDEEKATMAAEEKELVKNERESKKAL